MKSKSKLGELWENWGTLGELSIWDILTWGTTRGGAQRPAFKKLGKNPLRLRLVREQNLKGTVKSELKKEL